MEHWMRFSECEGDLLIDIMKGRIDIERFIDNINNKIIVISECILNIEKRFILIENWAFGEQCQKRVEVSVW